MVSRAERKAARSANSNPTADAMPKPEAAEAPATEAPQAPAPEAAPALDERKAIEKAARRAGMLEAADFLDREWGATGLLLAEAIRKRVAGLA